MANYPADAIGLFTIEGFSSMEDHKPDKSFKSSRVYNTIVFESEAGYEKRRLRSRRPKREYDLSYTNITGLQKEAIETFYNARGGNYDSFVMNLTHLSEIGNVSVRFEGDLAVTHVLSAGSNLLQNYYTVSFKLKETFG